MSTKRPKVRVYLHPAPLRELPHEHIAIILRGTHDILGRGGRTLLCQILRGSKGKKILELRLDQCPAYGYFRNESNEAVLGKIDWLIENYLLDYTYDGRLPVLVFTPAGWEIAKETISDELWKRFEECAVNDKKDYDFSDLRDRDRDMILLLLDKIERWGDVRFVPLLQQWAANDFKKVQSRIHSVMSALQRRTA